MIRQTTPADRAGVIALIISSGIFPESETEILDALFMDYFDGKARQGHNWIVDDVDGLRGTAYYAPEPMTDRAWNLLLLAVRPESQRQGVGTELVEFAESTLRDSGGRLLLIETSDTPDFASARAFYTKRGYEEEGRIRDYYAEGDAMITFRKKLNAAS